MANEKRLIDVNVLEMAFKETKMSSVFPNWANMNIMAKYAVAEFAKKVKSIVTNIPTVDAVVLPCKIGDDVYIIPSKVNFDLNVLANHKEDNRVYHQKVANIVFAEDGWYMTGSADMEYGTGRILLDRFYKETWFLTKKEAEAALAKMDGDRHE